MHYVRREPSWDFAPEHSSPCPVWWLMGGAVVSYVSYECPMSYVPY